MEEVVVSELVLDVVDSELVEEVVDSWTTASCARTRPLVVFKVVLVNLGVIRVVRHEVKVLVTGPRQQG